jgi:predicted DNA-binding antitoxin AbrB/MazE fold protein
MSADTETGGDTPMFQVIDAIYEHAMFRPLVDVHLPERQRVKIAIVSEEWVTSIDDLPAWALAALAEQSPSFTFLADPREDIYSLDDGEPVS